MLNNRTGNNSLNTTFINRKQNFNETRNLTQQDIQTTPHLIN